MATSIKLDDDLNGRIQRLAVARDSSAQSIMREAIRQYVEREEARDSFKREALASAAAYEATGRHLTTDEVSAWLDRWGEDVAPPPCHA